MVGDSKDGVSVWSGPENLVEITGETDADLAVDQGGGGAEVGVVAIDVLVVEVAESDLAAGAVVSDDEETAAETGRIVAALNAMVVIVVLIAKIVVSLGVETAACEDESCCGSPGLLRILIKYLFVLL